MEKRQQSGAAGKLKPFFDPAAAGRSMRVAAFLSGSGSNIVKLLEYQEKLKNAAGGSPFEVIFLFSDRSDGTCAGEHIACERGLPYFSYDVRTFHRLRGLRRNVLTREGFAARQAYDSLAKRLLEAFEIDLVALGGYMSYTTLAPCVNVHPADLSLCHADGRRKYIGDHAVRDAILAGEKFLRASTLWTDAGIDTGPLLMVSGAIEVVLPAPLEQLKNDPSALAAVVDEHQERLKAAGDWKIFPRTIELIARGRFSRDATGTVCMDTRPVPEGYREE